LGRKPTKVWDKYARDVVRGNVVAGKWVRLACERYIDDLAHGGARGLRFEPAQVEKVIDFFRLLRHSAGRLAGHPFEPAPWQKFILANIFGWYKKDGTRRFREAHVSVARGNGKTTTLSGIGLFMLVADGEQKAEIYAAATKEDQAKLIFAEAVRMRNSSPELAAHVGKSHKALFVTDTNSTFQPLGADSTTLDGLHAHAGLVDELHAHPTRALHDVLASGTTTRLQSLMFSITTAGYRKDCFCREQEILGEKILERVLNDDSKFYYMARLDKDDDWADEKTWPKANPNLGVSVELEDLRRKAKTAKDAPQSLNTFLTKNMNMWVSQETRWMPMERWAECIGTSLVDTDVWKVRQATLARLKGRRCWAGLDLAKTIDVSALLLLFPPAAEKTEEQDGKQVVIQAADPLWTVVPWFWVPAENVQLRVKTDQVPYDVWEREGFIIATEGDVVDQAFIRAGIREIRKDYKILELLYDPWNATQLSLELQADGLKVTELKQTVTVLTEPTSRLLAMVLGKELAHLGNPVLTWMASNVAVKKDANGNIRPDKDKSQERIDGIVALIMAIAGSIIATPPQSVYLTRGVITI